MMLLKNAVLFVFSFTIFSKQFNAADAKSLIGPNVRSVQINEYNFVVSVIEKQQNTNIMHRCLGTLISLKNVIVPAQCLRNQALRKIEIIVGSVDLRYGRRYQPYWWILYNEWAFQMRVELIFPDNNIAIMRLTEDVEHFIRPVSIRNMTDTELFGVLVTTAGWSYRDDGRLDTILKSAQLCLISKFDCNSRLEAATGHAVQTDLRVMCTISNPYVKLQIGDSGGPLIYENKIIAINIGSYIGYQSDVDAFKINFHTGLDFYKIFLTHILEFF